MQNKFLEREVISGFDLCLCFPFYQLWGIRTATFQALKWHAFPEQRKAEQRCNLMTALKFGILEEIKEKRIIFVHVLQVCVNLILSVCNYRWKVSSCYGICSFLSKKNTNMHKIL